jgi:uncharacterized protein YegP (UPF0339 family)
MGKFVISEVKNGYVFTLRAGNGQTIGVSEVYSSKSVALKGIESVVRNSQEAKIEDQTVEDHETKKNPKFEVYLDRSGEYRFRLKAVNGEPILASEGYTSRSGCLNGIKSVCENAPAADVCEEGEE